jgi:hypothetical protein
VTVIEGGGSGGSAALAELSSNADPAPPTREAPANVAAPLRKSRLSTKLFFVGSGVFSLGMVVLLSSKGIASEQKFFFNLYGASCRDGAQVAQRLFAVRFLQS